MNTNSGCGVENYIEMDREGGLPAVERANGTKKWYVDGKLHRDGGLPVIEHADGTKKWWVNNVFYTYDQVKMRGISVQKIST